MSSNNASYAIQTKARAKYGKMLNAGNYIDLTNCKSVQEIVSYLKQRTHYSVPLYEVKESAIFRGNLEKLILNYIREQQKEVVDLDRAVGANVFKFIEIKELARIILSYLRCLLASNRMDFVTKDPFGSNELYKQLLKSTTLKELGDYILTTPFSHVAPMFKSGDNFDYSIIESQLYKTSFDFAFESFQNKLDSNALKETKQLLALYTEIKDVQMLYRHKRFDTDAIIPPQRLLIGKRAFVSDDILKKLISVDNTDEFLDILFTTKYGKYKDKFGYSDFSLFLNKVLLANSLQKFHYSSISSVVLLAFMIILETEYKDLATVIEGVRYSFPPDTIQKMLINDIKRGV